jgi:hypothetical protein
MMTLNSVFVDKSDFTYQNFSEAGNTARNNFFLLLFSVLKFVAVEYPTTASQNVPHLMWKVVM